MSITWSLRTSLSPSLPPSLPRKNKHGVTRFVLDKMLERFEHRVSIETILLSEPPSQAPPTRKSEEATAAVATPTPNETVSSKGSLNVQQPAPTGLRNSGGLSPRLGRASSERDGQELHESTRRREGALKSSQEAKKLTERQDEAQKKSQEAKKLTEHVEREEEVKTCTVGSGGGSMTRRAISDSRTDSSSNGTKDRDTKDHTQQKGVAGGAPIREHLDSSDVVHKTGTAGVERGGESGLYGRKSKKKQLPSSFNKAPRFSKEDNKAEGVCEAKGEERQGAETSRSGQVRSRTQDGRNKTAEGAAAKGRDARLTGRKSCGTASVGGEDLTMEQWDSSEEMDLSDEGEGREGCGLEEDNKKEETTGNDNADHEIIVVKENGSLDQNKDSTQMPRPSFESDTVPLAPKDECGGVLGVCVATTSTDQELSGPRFDPTLIFRISSGAGERGRGSGRGLLKGAVDSTLHRKYVLEGELDERQLYSLKSQRLLMSQLIAERRSLCALAEDMINPPPLPLPSLSPSIKPFTSSSSSNIPSTSTLSPSLIPSTSSKPSTSTLSIPSTSSSSPSLSTKPSPSPLSPSPPPSCSSRGSELSSLTCMLEKMKVGGCHTFVSDEVVAQMFANTGQLLPRPFPVPHFLQQDPSLAELDQIPDWTKPRKKTSKLLKIVSERRREGERGRGVEAPDVLGVVLEVSGGRGSVCDGKVVNGDSGVAAFSKGERTAGESRTSLVSGAGGGSEIMGVGVASKSVSPLDSTVSGHNKMDSDDPLPESRTTPSVFPSALPSGSLDNLFSAFAPPTSAQLININAVTSQRDSLATPPQSSPTTARREEMSESDWSKPMSREGKSHDSVKHGGTSDSAVASDVESGRGLLLQATPPPKVPSNLDVLFGSSMANDGHSKWSHDQVLESHDKSHSSKKLLSVQELEQQMTTDSDEATFHSNGAQFHSDVAQFHSNGVIENGMAPISGMCVLPPLSVAMPTQTFITTTANGGVAGVPSNSPRLLPYPSSSPLPPSLEPWPWPNTSPTSLESWSPGSHASSHKEHITFTAHASRTKLGGDPLPTDDSLPGYLGPPFEDAAAEGFKLDVSGASSGCEVPEGSDLAFLQECFPDLDSTYLQQLLNRTSGNMEDAVSVALLTMVPLSLSSSLSSSGQHSGHADHAYFVARSWLLESQTSEESAFSASSSSVPSAAAGNSAGIDAVVSSTSLDSYHCQHPDPSQEASSLAGLDIIPTLTSVPASLPSLPPTIEDTSNDEEIARALQETLDKEQPLGTEKPLAESVDGGGVLYLESGSDASKGKVMKSEVEEAGASVLPLTNGVHHLESVEVVGGSGGVAGGCGEEENLLLRLTPSLARQLQELFGSIADHLPTPGTNNNTIHNLYLVGV